MSMAQVYEVLGETLESADPVLVRKLQSTITNYKTTNPNRYQAISRLQPLALDLFVVIDVVLPSPFDSF